MPGKSVPGKSAKVVAVALVAAGALTGCGGSPKVGAAAVVDDDRITVTTLSQTVRDWREQFRADPVANQLRANPGDPAQLAGESDSDVRGALTLLINFRVAEEAAERAGVKVTGTQVDQAVGLLDADANRIMGRPPTVRGGAESITLASGLPRRYTRDLARLVATQIAVRQAGMQWPGLFRGTASAMDIDVNPRYGNYDPREVGVGPVRYRLSSPDSGI
ncbi:hypothetical protein BZB76_4872 [Actinomadura pelletieri DSM 43383]|uniref:SurA-like protein n=1 Tax=Actinomadura pelletieri DSM 43383 TaxID=1120940 RepID=A0A495QIX0_9ACTN|nr:SurA N-terminal domain-containing protein [Actinomadura pelletieri]RKS72059.1 hypothetical protein BZB76_4872 [Actinomadura pelletieri DSM 43383]